MHPPPGRIWLLSQAEHAADAQAWDEVHALAQKALDLDPLDPDGLAFQLLAAAHVTRADAFSPPPGGPVCVSEDLPHREVGLFFSHIDSTWSERARFKDALRVAGLHDPENPRSVGSDEELDRDGCWHHWAWVRVADSDVAVARADRIATSIAKAHGVAYDGLKG